MHPRRTPWSTDPRRAAALILLAGILVAGLATTVARSGGRTTTAGHRGDAVRLDSEVASPRPKPSSAPVPTARIGRMSSLSVTTRPTTAPADSPPSTEPPSTSPRSTEPPSTSARSTSSMATASSETVTTPPAVDIAAPATSQPPPSLAASATSTAPTPPTTAPGTTVPAVPSTAGVVGTPRTFPLHTPAKLTVLAEVRTTGDPVEGVSFVHPGLRGEAALPGVTDHDGYWQDTLLGGCRTTSFIAPDGFRFIVTGRATFDHDWCVDPGGSSTIRLGLMPSGTHVWTFRAVRPDGSPVAGVEITFNNRTTTLRAVTAADGHAEIASAIPSCWQVWYAAPAHHLFKRARLVDGYGERLCPGGSGGTSVDLVPRDVSDGPTGFFEVLTGYRGFFTGTDEPSDPVSGVIIDLPGRPGQVGMTDEEGRFLYQAPVGCYGTGFDASKATDASGRGNLTFTLDGDPWVALLICIEEGKTRTTRLGVAPLDE